MRSQVLWYFHLLFLVTALQQFNGEKETKLEDGVVEKAIAKPPNKSACRDCCPRPKATVTVTETGYTTVTCTHTHSSDRIQTTTIRFTSTASALATKTERVNFVNTTTVVVSTQITFFETSVLAKYRIFTKTQTVFTSFAIATVVQTTRTASTRTFRTLVFTTTTSTSFTTITTQLINTATATKDITVDVASIAFTTVSQVVTTTTTVTSVIFTNTVFPNFTQTTFPQLTLIAITDFSNLYLPTTITYQSGPLSGAPNFVTFMTTVTTVTDYTNTGNFIVYASTSTTLTTDGCHRNETCCCAQDEDTTVNLSLLSAAILEYPDLNPVVAGLTDTESSSSQNSSDEFIPVLPNPPARLQANYDTETLGPGVSVKTDCGAGCPGCCTLPRVTVTETIELTSINFCFFTTTTVTTTDITQVITQTTTSIVTKTSILKLVETITRKTTSKVLSLSYTTTTITNTIYRTNTELKIASASTLEIRTSFSYISGTVTRLIPYFTPYSVYTDTETIFTTTFIIGFSTSTLVTELTVYPTSVFGTLTKILNIVDVTQVSQSTIVQEYTTAIQTMPQAITIQGVYTPTPLTQVDFGTVTLLNQRTVLQPYTATVIAFPDAGVTTTDPFTTIHTFSLIPP